MAEIAGIIWDFVGTLVKVSEPPAVTYGRIARKYGIIADPQRIARRLKEALDSAPPLCGFGEREEELARRWWKERIAFALDLPSPCLPGGILEELWEYYGKPSAWTPLWERIEIFVWYHRGGVSQAILSNNDSRLFSLVEGLRIPLPRDRVFPSSLLPWAKPDPRAFLSVAEVLGFSPSEILLVDDREENLRSAEEAGFQVRTPERLVLERSGGFDESALTEPVGKIKEKPKNQPDSQP
jgi:putative hydrolase of the HAD superfamily